MFLKAVILSGRMEIWMFTVRYVIENCQIRKEGITRDDQTLGVLTARGVVSCLSSSIVFSTIYW